MPRSDADRELMDLQRAMSVQGTTVAGLPSGASVAADPEALKAWEARRAAQREAYGQFVANCDIWIGNAPVFVTGQQVPLEHVINYDLEAREQVNRVATPELARVGKAFETDEEFLAANPHVARQVKDAARQAEAAPAALDPRGGGAAKDDARKASDSGGGGADDDTGKDDKPAKRPSGRSTKSTEEG